VAVLPVVRKAEGAVVRRGAALSKAEAVTVLPAARMAAGKAAADRDPQVAAAITEPADTEGSR
jgi:hypothetical protein